MLAISVVLARRDRQRSTCGSARQLQATPRPLVVCCSRLVLVLEPLPWWGHHQPWHWRQAALQCRRCALHLRTNVRGAGALAEKLDRIASHVSGAAFAELASEEGSKEM